jgi:hypothetical protein
MPDTSKLFLGIPTRRGYWIAFGAVVIFAGLAGLLYWLCDKGLAEFGVKVADCFLQGALVAIFFALLKGIIDNARA